MDLTKESVVCDEVESSTISDDTQREVPETDDSAFNVEETMEAEDFVVLEEEDAEGEEGEGDGDADETETPTVEPDIFVEENKVLPDDTDAIHTDKDMSEEISNDNTQQCRHTILNSRLCQAFLELSQRQALIEEFLELENGDKLEKFRKNREHLVDVMGFRQGTDVSKLDGKRSINSAELVGLLKVVKAQGSHGSGTRSRSEDTLSRSQRRRQNKKKLQTPPVTGTPQARLPTTPKATISNANKHSSRPDNTRHKPGNVAQRNNLPSTSSSRNIPARPTQKNNPNRNNNSVSRNKSRSSAGTRNIPRNDSRITAIPRDNARSRRNDSRSSMSIRNDSRNILPRNDLRDTIPVSRNDLSRNTGQMNVWSSGPWNESRSQSSVPGYSSSIPIWEHHHPQPQMDRFQPSIFNLPGSHHSFLPDLTSRLGVVQSLRDFMTKPHDLGNRSGISSKRVARRKTSR